MPQPSCGFNCLGCLFSKDSLRIYFFFLFFNNKKKWPHCKQVCEIFSFGCWKPVHLTQAETRGSQFRFILHDQINVTFCVFKYRTTKIRESDFSCWQVMKNTQIWRRVFYEGGKKTLLENLLVLHVFSVILKSIFDGLEDNCFQKWSESSRLILHHML